MTTATRPFSARSLTVANTTESPLSLPGTHASPAYDGASDHGPLSVAVNVSVARQATTDTWGGGVPSIRRVIAPTMSVGCSANARPAIAWLPVGAAPIGLLAG